MNHTPGPWHVERPFNEKGTYIAHTDSTALIARVYEGNIIVGKTLPDHGQANARLIAASPALLAALQRISFACSCLDNVMGDPIRLMEAKAELREANQQAMQAISKATDA